MSEPLSSVNWEHEIIRRPTEILLIFLKKDENIRGHIRFLDEEELEQWLKMLEGKSLKRE